MYSKDKSNRITLRVTDRQFSYIISKCEKLNISPSDFLRMIISQKIALEEGVRRENEQANIYNKL